MKVWAYTNNGLKYDHNEDSYIINGACRYGEKLSGEAEIYSAAVFDGVGGANAGEVASTLASKEAAKRIREELSADGLKKAIAEVNFAVVDKAKSQKNLGGMACTVAGVLFKKQETIVYNAGDSKVFKIKSGLMMQISVDDTFSAYAARMYGEDLGTRANDHRITAYLGNPNYDAEGLHISVLPPLDGDERYFICTDGVTDYIDLNYLESILTSDMPLAEISEKISRAVFSNGAKDNFTFIILNK